ncbi:unnamed protein product [Bursaphelenchus okinawaensis]|uniref:Uncharacterized protein n=1 Tax=Bursaphelenchus okinawaensis TaxID=465554 RepID=A0A811LAE1_9BILA|nr:unnamed protein product [Bursaphelenchus okinawaensis]CAG9120503.1 unnamed protein product [Bursaphelenchus okinawaensis]
MGNPKHSESRAKAKQDRLNDTDFYPCALPKLAPNRLRLLLMRSGETVNRLDRHFIDKAFGSDHYNFINCNQNLLPPGLTRDPQHYKDDDYSTVSSAFMDFSIGKYMRKIGLTPDIVFSSPAFRCLQTAATVLAGCEESKVKLTVEPGLFEPMGFYEECPKFIDPRRSKFPNPIDERKPIVSLETLKTACRIESTNSFYHRIGSVIRRILDSLRADTECTVLIVTHAPVIDGIIRYMMRMFCPIKYAEIVRCGIAYPFHSIVTLEREIGRTAGRKSRHWALNPFIFPPNYSPNFELHPKIPTHRPVFGEKKRTKTNSTRN